MKNKIPMVEAAIKYREKFTPNKIVEAHLQDAFIAGANWQLEQYKNDRQDFEKYLFANYKKTTMADFYTHIDCDYPLVWIEKIKNEFDNLKSKKQ